jgi:hypothetical protein
VLAFAALIATAGVAFAAGGDDRGSGAAGAGAELDHVGHGRDVPGANDVEKNDVGKHNVDGHTVDDTNGGATADGVGDAGSDGVGAFGENQGSGAVTGTSVDDLSTPVEAPAAAASGPAPDAAAAAPVTGLVADAFVVESVTAVAPGGDGSAPTDAPVTEPAVAAAVPDMAGLAGLPDLGSVGVVTARVTDGPTAARALLSTGPGRSLAVVAVLLLIIGLFLSVHRWADRGDRKLAAARSGSDVARFR